MIDACLPRSRANLRAAILSVDPEHAADLQKRDVDGKPGDETFCNYALVRLLRALGLLVPSLLANDLVDWIFGEGKYKGSGGPREGWREIFDTKQAIDLIERGFPVVFMLKEPGHGHCALGSPEEPIVPGRPLELRIAQAGGKNYNCAPISWGFGRKSYRTFFHA